MICQAEKLADTNQVDGDFCQQPVTFDNPVPPHEDHQYMVETSQSK